VVNSKFYGKVFGSSFLLVLLLAMTSLAQTKSTVVYKRESKPLPVAVRNNLYCAGYIQTTPINTDYEIVGADDEREQHIYSQGEYIYIGQGSSKGVKVGDTFSVIRPRGQFKSKFSEKRGNLGFYVQEVGMVEIVKVRSDISVAKVKSSCEDFLLGDLLQLTENRVVPNATARPKLDIFAEPNGKTTGKIVMARDAREAVTRDQIVYIDLGAEDSVKVGDYLTVFRPLGKGGVLNIQPKEEMSTRDGDFASETFTGNPFSNMSPRKAGDTAQGERVTSKKAKSRRPAGLRKIVGEMIILKVSEKTATALIVRNAQEIHVGDAVEIQ
jgi:hypothetical protein